MPVAPGFPATEDEAKTCVHDNVVWFGNECGLCEDAGHYWWKGELLSYEDAISYAIFAINTFMHPEASSNDDVDRLQRHADVVVATLVDMRETVTT